jgi:CDP-diacylglycerol--serine O-phosphatidyltransferase
LRFIGFYDYTVILTYASLASAIFGIFEASKGNLRLAVLCIIGSGLCDMFDGVVARSKKNRTQDQKNFGIQIDSLVDVIAFGVTPAAVFYFHGVNSALGVAILIFYVMCGVIRLGFFNVLETKRQSDPNESACAKEFRGMPITYSAALTPLICAIAYVLPAEVSIYVYYIAPLLMGFCFILDIRIPKINLTTVSI